MIINNGAVVIGNGESRAGIDLRPLKNYITLIGCNAVHRDLVVDHLVCCDQRMVRESCSNKKIKSIFTRQRYYKDFHKVLSKEKVKLLPDIPYQGTLKPDQSEHWGSGPYATLLACHLNFQNIYIVGFDLYSRTHFVNNVYKNTQNYLPENKPAVDPAYWIYQMRKLFLTYENKSFKLFNLSDWKCPEEWILPNVNVFDVNNLFVELDYNVNSLYNINSPEALDAQPS